jgi:hypothetical protein
VPYGIVLADQENEFALVFLVGAVLLNLTVFTFMFRTGKGRRIGDYLIILFNPIIFPLLVILLNEAHAETYNDYLWKATVLPVFLYAFMHFVAYAIRPLPIGRVAGF